MVRYSPATASVDYLVISFSRCFPFAWKKKAPAVVVSLTKSAMIHRTKDLRFYMIGQVEACATILIPTKKIVISTSLLRGRHRAVEWRAAKIQKMDGQHELVFPMQIVVPTTSHDGTAVGSSSHSWCYYHREMEGSNGARTLRHGFVPWIDNAW